MKFRFPFETLLKQRNILRDEAQREFRNAMNKVDDATGILQEMRHMLQVAREDVRTVRDGGGQLVGSLKSYEEFIEGQKIRIQNQIKLVKSLEEIAEKKRDALIEANRDLKSLEKLKEKRYNEFVKQAQKKDMKFIDEISVMRAAREKV